jgi:hypothetical protein
LFRGDEVGNAASADLSKVQQFLITTIVLLVYASSIVRCLYGDPSKGALVTDDLKQLPELGDHVIWLIGISHAGYLGYKATSHPGVAASIPADTATDGTAAVG